MYYIALQPLEVLYGVIVTDNHFALVCEKSLTTTVYPWQHFFHHIDVKRQSNRKAYFSPRRICLQENEPWDEVHCISHLFANSAGYGVQYYSANETSIYPAVAIWDDERLKAWGYMMPAETTGTAEEEETFL